MTEACTHPKWVRSVMKSGEVWYMCPKCGTRRVKPAPKT
jgi:predicted RNA-binding Zn-ribbon protein involved in translation (DUF1610 family)